MHKKDLQSVTNLLNCKKNIILQGAPGVGKTYTTAALALSICGEKIPDNHADVMNRYEELQKEGRIGFVTFHQSLDYEDFVEGIKPQIINEDKMIYKVEDGIFKQISLRAKPISNSLKNEAIDFSRTKVFKMTINDDQVFNYCFNNKVIALCPYKNDPQNEEDFKTTQTAALQRFNEWMEVGDIVLITKNLTEVRAIAKITSQAHFEDSMSIGLCQIRSVEWLYNDSLHISKIFNNPYFGTQRIYGFYRDAKYGTPSFNSDNIKTDVLNNIINGTYNDDSQPYVLIIDEINRGNVSKIFGELITLLEADKRIGGKHPLKVTLPYSKTEFGVPSNLYIIGTMNTTDRSVGNIDYAVRRRFAFVTLESDKDVVKQQSTPKALELFEAVEAFIKKNQIEMDFEDLLVGHSYFIADNETELKMKWDYEIIPLLREYYKDGLLKQDVTPETTIPQFVGTWRAASLPNQPTETQSAASTQTF